MLRGTSPLLRLPARALINGKPVTTSTASFHRLSPSNGVLRQLRPRSLPQASTVVWRAQYASKPYIPPSEIKKAEKEAAERKLEAHPESVTSTSTTAGALLPDTEPSEGTKVTKRQQLVDKGHDLPRLARILVRAFLRQAVVDGFFHADLHQGNLIALDDGRLAAVDFGIMGRIDRQARLWLAEILYGLITGNYRRVAEIHFEAQYVPAHHSVEEFATALRAVGEPIRGLPVKDISVGRMLEGLFAITHDFDMATQPHLLLLQKTMVMEEGVVVGLDPDINMWEVSEPFLANWMRTELGPETFIADKFTALRRTIERLPHLIDKIDASYPEKGGAPPEAPLPEVKIIERPNFLGYFLTALISGSAGAALVALL